jgi:hydrogenase maturation protease
VLGLCNDLRCDDGVGLQVVRCLQAQGLPEGIAAEEAGTAGLGLLDLICGYQRLVIVDAIDAGAEPGTIIELGLDDLATLMPLHTTSTHDANLGAVLALGRRLDLDLPTEIRIVAIQVADTLTLSEHCTPAVQQAIDAACLTVMRAAGRPVSEHQGMSGDLCS